MKKKNALIYPYDITGMHVIEYSSEFTDYDIKQVISPAGWGYAYRDAGDRAGIATGLIVMDYHADDLAEIDTVILLDSEIKLDPAHFDRIIFLALEANKEVIDLRSESSGQNFSERYHRFGNETRSNENRQFKENRKLRNIQKPIVLVLGSGERTNKFDVQLLIRKCFADEGYHLTQIGSKPFCEYYGFHGFPGFMYDQEVSLADKIIKFNHYVEYLSRKENSDVIVIGVPGGVAVHNHENLNDFGLLAFMVWNAANPDYVVVNASYMDTMTDSLQCPYEADAIFLSNQYINWKTVHTMDQLDYMTLDQQKVRWEAERCGAYSIYTASHREKFRKHLLATLTGCSTNKAGIY